MKAMIMFICVMGLLLLAIPMIALRTATPAADPQQRSESLPPAASQAENPGGAAFTVPNSAPAESAPEAGPEVEDAQAFKILDQTTGEVKTVPLRDFVRGAVAAEMPALFHPEALKAQAVAAHTFALHSRLQQQESPDPALKGADFEADPSNMKVYITEEAAREFYGDDADFYWQKICDAADSVLNVVLVYDDEPIVAAYHAISAGRTEDASNVWIGSAPYLAPVDSSGDILAPDFESTETFTDEEARVRLASAVPGLELSGDPAGWFGEPVRSESGYVLTIPVGDTEVAGKDIRTIFDLRSHHFEVSHVDGEFVFTVEGYGHGVGLSQNGADFMARQGATFEEILANYYSGVSIAKGAG